jgi:hypothetical protein
MLYPLPYAAIPGNYGRCEENVTVPVAFLADFVDTYL